MQISFAVTAELISAFVFNIWIVQFFYFLNPNFPASSLYIFCACTARFVSDLFGKHIVVFLIPSSNHLSPVYKNQTTFSKQSYGEIVFNNFEQIPSLSGLPIQFEPLHKKRNNLHKQKQRRRSALRLLHS